MDNVAVSFYDSNDQRILGAQAEVETAFGLRNSVPNSNMVPVVVQPKHARYVKGTINLFDFKHPEKAHYIFGPNNQHLREYEVPENSLIVYIEQELQNATLYSHQACAIILYDRLYKYRKWH